MILEPTETGKNIGWDHEAREHFVWHQMETVGHTVPFSNNNQNDAAKANSDTSAYKFIDWLSNANNAVA